MAKWKFDSTKVKIFREGKGWSQQVMADKLKMTRAQYGRLEQSNRVWSVKTLFRICEVLDIIPQTFLVENKEDVACLR